METLKNLFKPALLSLVFLTGCNDHDQMARLKITLVDTPSNYTAVNVDIQGVRVHASEQADEEDGGWIDFEGSNVGVVNLQVAQN